jgi:cation-transporting ATPase 13A3/4/5
MDFRARMQDAIGMKLKPYKKTMLGEATYLLLISMCIMWFVTLGIIVFDCYNQCQLTGIDAMCFYGNYPVFGSYTPNSYYFFAWWWGAMLWLGMWIYFKEEVRCNEKVAGCF